MCACVCVCVCVYVCVCPCVCVRACVCVCVIYSLFIVVLLSHVHVLLGNTCLLVMCQGLQSQFAACTEATGGFILQQFGQSDPPSLDHAFSVVKLVLQVCVCLRCDMRTIAAH